MSRLPAERHPLGAAGLLAIGLGLWLQAGPVGVAATAVLGLLWLSVPPVYVVAVAHLGLVTLSPESASLPALLAVEAGAAGVLVGPNASLRDGLTVGLAIAGLLSIVWGLRRWTDEPWLHAAGLVVVVALFAYALHRYELVRLGLVGGDAA